ncbi:MAG: ATP-dependent zinc metalloprotease FtsH [Vulcanimicrobiaceae bacterium]
MFSYRLYYPDVMPEPPQRSNLPDKSPRWGMLAAILWYVFAGLAIVWSMAWFFQSSSPSPTRIAYSTFVAQVRAGNVSEVSFSGDQISGTMVKPFADAHRTFRTTYPATIGDPALMPLLETRKVKVEVTAQAAPWYLAVLNWLPFLIFGGLLVWILGAGARGQGSAISSFGRAKPQRYSSEHVSVTFDDIAGVNEAKAELQEEVDFLRRPEKYRRLGAHIPKGVLLVGAPGTGKTLLARAVAGQAGAAFFSLNASEFVEMFVGVGASRVRDLFAQAKAAAPAIVFIDELDAVGRRRGAGVGTVNDEREQTLNQLLAELDGFDQRLNVIILAATNRPDVLDPALLRPGRFDRQVVLELPDRAGREAILRIHVRDLRLAQGVDLTILARTTIGQSGADLANLCNEAALTAARRDHDAVTMADFEEAQDKLRLGVAHPHLADPLERRVVAYHESGHALVAWLTPSADPVQKVTIIPHGQAIGQTQQVPGEERHNLSASYLKARLAVLLAGRTSEEIVFGEVTTGAENDLVEATTLARRMVTRWGMGELGLFAVKADEEQPFLGYEMAQRPDYSEATAARIDRDVQSLLTKAHDEVRRRLTDARDRLDSLASALLQEETLELADLTQILGPRQNEATAVVESLK